MKKTLMTSVLLICAAMNSLQADEETAADATVLVGLGQVESRVIPQVLRASGMLQATSDTVLTIAVRHAGQVARVAVTPGSRVSAGAVLVELDIAPAARVEFQQASAALELARGEMTRQQRLLDEKLSTRAQLDSAHKALADATAQLESLRLQGQDQDREILRAPMAAIVTTVDATPGQRLAADAGVVALSGVGKLVAVLGVEPEKAASLHAGMPVHVQPVFDESTRVNGAIGSVGGLIDPQTHTVDVRVVLDLESAASTGLLPGSPVMAQIETARGDSLAVPHSAVLRDQQGDATIYTVANGVARRIAVQTGAEQDGFIGVRGELSAGMPVVVSGNYELADGMRVREDKP